MMINLPQKEGKSGAEQYTKINMKNNKHKNIVVHDRTSTIINLHYNFFLNLSQKQ